MLRKSPDWQPAACDWLSVCGSILPGSPSRDTSYTMYLGAKPVPRTYTANNTISSAHDSLVLYRAKMGQVVQGSCAESVAKHTQPSANTGLDLRKEAIANVNLIPKLCIKGPGENTGNHHRCNVQPSPIYYADVYLSLYHLTKPSYFPRYQEATKSQSFQYYDRKPQFNDV